MVKALLLVWLAELVCGCTAHAVRCDGRLEPINAPTAGAPPVPGAKPAADAAQAAGSVPGVQ